MINHRTGAAVTAIGSAGVHRPPAGRPQYIALADVSPTVQLRQVPAPARLGRYWMFIAVVAIVCFGATAGYAFVVPPKWEASAHILVAPVSADVDVPGLGLVSDSLEPARSLQTAIALLDTPVAAAATADKLGEPWTATTVDRGIVLEPLGQSYVVRVLAQGDSATEAARLATTFAESATEIRDREIKKKASELLALRTSLPTDATASASSAATWARLELIIRTGDPSLSMAQPASAPSSPAGLPVLYKLGLAAVLGLGLGVAGAWVRSRRATRNDGARARVHALDDRGRAE